MTAEEYISKILDLQETDSEQALTVCDEGIAAYPNNAKLYYLKAETLWSQENFDSTILRNLLKKSSELDPHYAAPYFLWGYFNERLCCPDEALYCYQRVVELDPSNAAGWYRLGKLEQEEFGNLPGALKAFDKVVALAPNDQAYNSRGHLRMEMNDFSGAIEDFNKALELNPQAGLAVLAFRSAQTKTSLRLSSPVTHQAVGAFGRKKPPLKAVLRTAPTRT